MRRKVGGKDWRFPHRMTFTQWRRLSYRHRHWYLAEMQCTLLGFWRDCPAPRCRRARKCRTPHPCYWDRKRAMPAEDWAKAEAACRPLRDLLGLGSTKGAEGLWLF